MANTWYTVTYDNTPYTRSRADNIDAETGAIEDAFDLMPTLTQMRSGNVTFVAAGGTADAITVAHPYSTWTTYTGKDGFVICIQITTENTGAVTLNVDSLGAKAVVTNDGSALAAGDLQATGFYFFFYDETAGNFKCPNAGLNSVLAQVTADAATVAADKATVADDKATVQSLTSTAITETVYNLTGTEIDPDNGTIQYKTLGSNTTFTETIADGEAITLMIDDGSGYTITWPTTTWVGGSAPTLETSGYNVIELWQVNSTLYGAFMGAA